MKNSPRSAKITVLIQIIIVVFIRTYYGDTVALWSLIPVILLGIIVTFLIGRFTSKDKKSEQEMI